MSPRARASPRASQLRREGPVLTTLGHLLTQDLRQVLQHIRARSLQRMVLMR